MADKRCKTDVDEKEPSRWKAVQESGYQLVRSESRMANWLPMSTNKSSSRSTSQHSCRSRSRSRSQERTSRKPSPEVAISAGQREEQEGTPVRDEVPAPVATIREDLKVIRDELINQILPFKRNYNGLQKRCDDLEVQQAKRLKSCCTDKFQSKIVELADQKRADEAKPLTQMSELTCICKSCLSLSAIEGELNLVKNQLAKCKEELATIKQNCDAAKAGLAQEKELTQVLRTKNKQMEDDMTNQITQLTAELKSRVEQLAEAEEKLLRQETVSEKKLLEGTKRESVLKAQLDESKAQMKKVQKQNEEAKNAHAVESNRLRSERNHLRRRQSVPSSTAAESSVASASTTDNNTTELLQKLRTKHEIETQALKVANEGLTTDLLRAQGQLEESRNQRAHLLQSVGRQLKLLRKDLTGNLLRFFKRELRETKNQLNFLSKKVDAYVAAYEKNVAETKPAQSDDMTQLIRLTTLAKDNEILQEKLAEHSRSVQSLTTRLKDAESKLADADERFRRSEKLIHDHTQEYENYAARLKAEVDKLYDEKRSAQLRAESLKSRIGELNRQLNDGAAFEDPAVSNVAKKPRLKGKALLSDAEVQVGSCGTEPETNSKLTQTELPPVSRSLDGSVNKVFTHSQADLLLRLAELDEQIHRLRGNNRSDSL